MIQAKTYGYNDFSLIRGRSIVFDSFGDYFYEVGKFQTNADPKFKLLFRRVEIYQLKQIWTMTFGTSTGDLAISKGTRLSPDDAYLFVPFDPSSNSDYRPVPTNNYVGLMSVQTDVGISYWVNVYTPTTQFAVVPVDGDVSPDNIRYYYLLKEATTTYYGGILILKVADGTIVKFIRFGDKDTIPMAIVASKLDRIAFNSRIRAGTGIYFND